MKEVYADRPQVYADFLEIIKGFQEGRIETAGVIAGVSKLFQGHEELLGGFNAFLPEGHRMPVPPVKPTFTPEIPPPKATPPGPKPLQMMDAMKYMDKVRDTFSNKSEVYMEFLDIMKSFQAQK